jgi:hypothetical protein
MSFFFSLYKIREQEGRTGKQNRFCLGEENKDIMDSLKLRSDNMTMRQHRKQEFEDTPIHTGNTHTHKRV